MIKMAEIYSEKELKEKKERRKKEENENEHIYNVCPLVIMHVLCTGCL